MSAATPSPRASRRALLKGLAVAFLGTAGMAVARIRGRGYDLGRARPPIALATWELVVVTHAARRIAAPDRSDGTVPSSDELDVAGFVDKFVGRMPGPMRRDLSRALMFLEHIAPLTLGLTARFSDLPPSDQDRVLASLETSPITILRGAFAGLKSLVFMGFYRDPRTWQLLGYEGPWVGRSPR